MITTALWFQFFFTIGACIAVIVAYEIGKREGKRIHSMHDINHYITRNWPDHKAAYTHGVKEGYAQAMRDMREHDG